VSIRIRRTTRIRNHQLNLRTVRHLEKACWLSESDLRLAPDPGYNVVLVRLPRMCTTWRLDLHAQVRRWCMTSLRLPVDGRTSKRRSLLPRRCLRCISWCSRAALRQQRLPEQKEELHNSRGTSKRDPLSFSGLIAIGWWPEPRQNDKHQDRHSGTRDVREEVTSSTCRRGL
jgi:hypothetical protein